MQKTKFIPSFGRKRARGLSDNQKNDLTTLYKIYGIDLSTEDISPTSFFNDQYKKIYMEIGFGNGEHLIKNALRNPEIAFIGCEPFENGVATILREIEENKLKNIRVYNGDARILLEQIKFNTINRFYVLFPDPWPKKRHHKRRILSEEFIKNIRKNHPGELVIATDCEDYISEVVKHLDNLGIYHCDDLSELSQRPDWFLGTKYEQKAIDSGSKCYYLKVKI